MPVHFPLSEFFESAGKSTTVFTEQIRDESVRFACEIWNSYPKWLTKIPTPSASFVRGFMNTACSPIQPPVPAPNILEYTGGQCPNITYNVAWQIRNYNPSNCNGDLLSGNETAVGALGQIGFELTGGAGGTTNCDPANQGKGWEPVRWYIESSQGRVYFSTGTFVYNVESPAFTSSVESVIVTRIDGQPDNCGDPPSQYPDGQPTPQELSKTVNITVNDGDDFPLTIQFTKNSDTYNFPISLRVNGARAVLDLSGLTIYGDTQYTSTETNITINPPNSDNPVTPDGDELNIVINSEFPTLPDLTVPETVKDVIERIVCNEGVLSIFDEIVDVIPSNSLLLKIVLQAVNSLIRDACEIEEQVEAIVALPEYYGVKLSLQRPAICYIYKEQIDGRWGRSTYSSTLTYPSPSAIAEIDTIEAFDKPMGTHRAKLALSDGACLKATGITQQDALDNLQFLIDRVEPSRLPSNISQEIVLTEYRKLQEKTVRLRQIEYYPNGAGNNVSPQKRRIID